MEEKFSINPYLTDLLILNETVKQIQKDFAFFALPVIFSGKETSAYQELFDQIQPHIKRLMDDDYQKFLSLLYRVDINEKQLQTENEPSAHLTELIIKRCLQKVVFRKLYSK